MEGLRDGAILVTLLDTMARVSEVAGANASSLDLEGRTLGVMGKGRKERDLPLGKTATRALQRYRNAVDGLQHDDPFFIPYRGRRLDRSVITDMVADYGRAAGITGVR
jgi:site-specific recombinase XerC